MTSKEITALTEYLTFKLCEEHDIFNETNQDHVDITLNKSTLSKLISLLERIRTVSVDCNIPRETIRLMPEDELEKYIKRSMCTKTADLLINEHCVKLFTIDDLGPFYERKVKGVISIVMPE